MKDTVFSLGEILYQSIGAIVGAILCAAFFTAGVVILALKGNPIYGFMLIAAAVAFYGVCCYCASWVRANA